MSIIVLLPLIQVHSLAVGLPTNIVAVPDFEVSCVEVAVIAAAPVAVGVNTPEEVIVPSDAAQVTAELYDPVPCTVAVQLDVCVASTDAGEQTTATDIIVDVEVPPPLLLAVPLPQPTIRSGIDAARMILDRLNEGADAL